MICVWIDEFVPCLKKASTGELFDTESRATYVAWMVANPNSNPQRSDSKEYIGIGGHLFAIAVDRSIDYGTNGEIYGFAANKDLLNHYINTFNATYIGLLHTNHFLIEEESALKIKREYNYEWTDEEL